MECHGMQSQHGTSLVEDVSDCRSCHHTEERVDDDCAECHLVDDMKEEIHIVQRTFVLTVTDDPSDRDLPFTHVAHEERECAECHAEGPSLAVPDLDCQSCHEEHHEATVSRSPHKSGRFATALRSSEIQGCGPRENNPCWGPLRSVRSEQPRKGKRCRTASFIKVTKSGSQIRPSPSR